jgi:hypothetical protein
MKEGLLEELENLRQVLGWSKEHGGITSGQRICIHQECASHIKKIAAIENDSPYQNCGGYKIPDHLQEKVQHIQMVIKNTGWIKEEIKY